MVNCFERVFIENGGKFFSLQLIVGWTLRTSDSSRDSLCGRTGRKWTKPSGELDSRMISTLGRKFASIWPLEMGNCTTSNAFTPLIPSSANWPKKICRV